MLFCHVSKWMGKESQLIVISFPVSLSIPGFALYIYLESTLYVLDFDISTCMYFYSGSSVITLSVDVFCMYFDIKQHFLQ